MKDRDPAVQSTAMPEKVLEVTLSQVDAVFDWDFPTKVPKFEDATIVHAGTAFNKGAMGTWSDCYISEFVQYNAANMWIGGIKMNSVPKNQNQETQIILLSATKPDNVLEVSTGLIRDHIWLMITREEQALEVILQLCIYVKRRSACRPPCVTCTST